jgi:hypothetical protein
MDPTAIVDGPKKEYFAPAGNRTTNRRTSILQPFHCTAMLFRLLGNSFSYQTLYGLVC